MKYSTYNNWLDFTEDVTAVYNSATDSFVLINGKDNLIDKSPKDLQLIDERLYKELCGIGAILPKDTDEYRTQLLKSQRIRMNDEMFQLMINPTLDCNLHCWYCYEKHIKGSAILPYTLDNIFSLISNISMKQNIKVFSLSFFGGEPLLEFDSVKKIILHTSSCCAKRNIVLRISFTSNAVLIDNKIITFFKKHKLDVSFQVTLDGGRENHNKTSFTSHRGETYDVIMHNVQSLLENQIPVTLRINYTIKNFSSISTIVNDMADWEEEYKKFVQVDLQRVWQDGIEELDIESVMQEFRNKGYNVTSPLLDIDYCIHPCYADCENQLLINYNGDVYKCTARDFTEANCCGKLMGNGRINWAHMTPKERIINILPPQICSTCSIFPLCGGGCIQKRMEQPDNVCIYDLDEQKKRDIILNRFYNYVVKGNQCLYK